jgi:AcrR family transcriptional regulator
MPFAPASVPVADPAADPAVDDSGARHRAAPLPPEERRAAIVSATIPLLIAHGSKLTTRQIAEAAGIAEGTIFRVFPDKESLVEAAVETAFDPEPVDVALRAIDRSIPLDQRLTMAVEIIQRRVSEVWQLMSAIGMARPPTRVGAANDDPRRRDTTALADVFEPDRDQLRRDPTACAEALRGLIFGTSHPALVVEPLAPAEVVSLLLDGVRSAPRAPESGKAAE